MSELLNNRLDKSDKVFELYCAGVRPGLRKIINRHRLSFLGCRYSQEAQTEIIAAAPFSATLVDLTPETLKSIMPSLSNAFAQKYTPVLNAAMKEFGIDTAFRRNMFLAQVAHESNDLQWLIEKSAKGIIAEDYFNKKYSKREDLGNNQPGDGARFRGRGVIQITGRHNYKQVGKGLGLDLLEKPELLEDPVIAIRASAFWWKKNGLNIHTGKYPYDILGASVSVNGINEHGLPNHLEERKKRFVRISTLLGI